MVEQWPRYFKNGGGVTRKQIRELQVFDAVLDLYKCDPNFLRWDCAVKRQWTTVIDQGTYLIQAYRGRKHMGLLREILPQDIRYCVVLRVR